MEREHEPTQFDRLIYAVKELCERPERPAAGSDELPPPQPSLPASSSETVRPPPPAPGHDGGIVHSRLKNAYIRLDQDDASDADVNSRMIGANIAISNTKLFLENLLDSDRAGRCHIENLVVELEATLAALRLQSAINPLER